MSLINLNSAHSDAYSQNFANYLRNCRSAKLHHRQHLDWREANPLDQSPGDGVPIGLRAIRMKPLCGPNLQSQRLERRASGRAYEDLARRGPMLHESVSRVFHPKLHSKTHKVLR